MGVQQQVLTTYFKILQIFARQRAAQEEEEKEQSIGREQSVTQQRILTPQRHSGY